MNREPIHYWMEREKGIGRDQWNAMVDRAADQFLRETAPIQSTKPALTLAQLEAEDRIAASELGGSVERILAKALGWEGYKSRPEHLEPLTFDQQTGEAR